MAKATSSTDLLTLVSDLQNRKQYQELNWTGTFCEYLEIVERNPLVTRTAFQRIYDMIMSYGTEEFIDAKKKLIRYQASSLIRRSTRTTRSSASRSR